MLTKSELELLTADESAFYENAGMFDRAKMEPALRERVQQRAKDRAIDLDAVTSEQTELPVVDTSSRGSREYKIFTSHDKGLLGRFDPESIEAALNAYARQGWVVVTSTTTTFRGWVTAKEELLIVLERVR